MPESSPVDEEASHHDLKPAAYDNIMDNNDGGDGDDGDIVEDDYFEPRPFDSSQHGGPKSDIRSFATSTSASHNSEQITNELKRLRETIDKLVTSENSSEPQQQKLVDMQSAKSRRQGPPSRS